MKHLEALDGLRGLAALGVLAYHLGHWWHVPGLASNAYLAVDFFFCLSGYVLPLAYDGPKHRGLGFTAFCVLRLVRLMPLILLATLVSAAYLALKLTMAHAGDSFPALGKALVLGALSLPDLSAPAAIGGPQVFPLNGPQYTLMLELGVNVLWFAMRRHATLPVALGISALSFALLAHTGLGGDTPATLLAGIPRVLASFFAGVALFRATHGLARPSRPGSRSSLVATAGGAAAAIVMLAVFFWPHALPLPLVLLWSAAVVPLLVFAGARMPLAGAARPLAAGLGALSYPVYALHYPIFCWVNGLMQLRLHHQSPALEAPVVVAAVIGGSLIALRRYDEPLRRWLSRQTGAGRVPAPVQAVAARP